MLEVRGFFVRTSLIEFAVGFYNALGTGRIVEDAYEFGCNAIQMAGISEYQTPILRKSPNLNDPARIAGCDQCIAWALD